jgi:diguanylate cyclase (GGDEF)-like protein
VRVLDGTDRHPSWWLTAMAALAVVAVGVVDYASGSKLTFSIFYLLPVFLVSAATPLPSRAAVSVLAAGVWGGAEVAALASIGETSAAAVVWNLAVRLGIFFLVGYLASALRTSLVHERELSRTDPLTGLANRRGFFAAAEAAARSARPCGPITLAYLDLDHFKQLNDSAGHAAGDAVLQCVGASLAVRVRSTDIAGRLGGDEFAVLLPDTDAVGAATLVHDLHKRLVAALDRDGWPVGVSIGAVTFPVAPLSFDELVRAADEAMYEAKNTGRGGLVLREAHEITSP